MTGKGSTEISQNCPRQVQGICRAGLMVEYMRDLRQMSEILNLEGRHADELKVLLLEFYVMLNCGEAIPAIDRELVSSIRKAAVAVGASKYDVEELLLTMIHDDTTPRRSFTHQGQPICSGALHERRVGQSRVDCSQIQKGVIPLTIWKKVVKYGGGKHKG